MYLYRDEAGRKHKYSQYCIEKNFKTENSYNYKSLKETKYCKKQKLNDMVNVKRGHKLCLVCRESYKKKHVKVLNVDLQFKNITLLQNIFKVEL